MEKPKITTKFTIRATPKTIIKFKVMAAKYNIKHGDLLAKLLIITKQ